MLYYLGAITAYNNYNILCILLNVYCKDFIANRLCKQLANNDTLNYMLLRQF